MPKRRSRPACSNPITRRARGFACEVDRVNPGEALLAFGAKMPPGTEHAAIVLNLSPGGDLVEAATNLFSDLRTLDQADVATIAVMPVPARGPRRSHQRPACARRRAKGELPSP